MHGGKWQIGDVSITRMVEMEVTGGTRFLLPQAHPDVIREIPWLFPNFANERGKLKMSFHALVIETPERRIIVDTCLGNDKIRDEPSWSHLQTGFLDDLCAEGYAPETIDTVLCTHLHVDHVGWNTMLVDGVWVPTFPKARYLIAGAEFDHAMGNPEAENQQIMSDSVTPVFEAGLVDLVETTHEICPEVRLLPTHGHTPGHVSVLIESGGERAMITGDFLHHPCQMHRPDWSSALDTDPEESVRTRHAIFGAYADTPTLIIGTHFASPSAGHLVSDGDVWRLKID